MGRRIRWECGGSKGTIRVPSNSTRKLSLWKIIPSVRLETNTSRARNGDPKVGRNLRGSAWNAGVPSECLQTQRVSCRSLEVLPGKSIFPSVRLATDTSRARNGDPKVGRNLRGSAWNGGVPSECPQTQLVSCRLLEVLPGKSIFPSVRRETDTSRARNGGPKVGCNLRESAGNAGVPSESRKINISISKTGDENLCLGMLPEDLFLSTIEMGNLSPGIGFFGTLGMR